MILVVAHLAVIKIPQRIPHGCGGIGWKISQKPSADRKFPVQLANRLDPSRRTVNRIFLPPRLRCPIQGIRSPLPWFLGRCPRLRWGGALLLKRSRGGRLGSTLRDQQSSIQERGGAGRRLTIVDWGLGIVDFVRGGVWQCREVQVLSGRWDLSLCDHAAAGAEVSGRRRQGPKQSTPSVA